MAKNNSLTSALKTVSPTLRALAPVLLACLAYIAIHGAIQLYLFAARPSPPEPDDIYTYLLRAAQVAQGCGLQDCPAINDLRNQLSDPVADPDAERSRYRLLLLTTVVLTHLYTAIVLGLNQLGLEWEQAYTLASILGVAVIAGGLGYLLSALWGPNAAAIGVLIVALAKFKGQGLFLIVPSNITLGIGLFLWGAAIRGHRGWPLLLLSAAALLMHPLGKLYCVIAIPMMLLMEGRVLPAWRTGLTCAGILALVGLSTLAPVLIERPLMSVPPALWPSDVSWLGLILKNVVRGVQTVLTFDGRELPFSLIVAAGIYVLAWLGYTRLDADDKRRVFAVGLPLAGLCLVSLGHTLLGYPGEAFIRVWIPLAAVLAGSAGYALVGPAGLLYAPASARLPGRLSFLKARATSLTFLAVAAGSGVLTLMLAVEAARIRHFETYVSKQVERAVASCGTLLFAGETPALFYLLHGAHRCSVRYLLATELSRRSSLAEGLHGAPRPLLLVAPQPGPRELQLDRRYPLRLEIPRAAAGRIEFKIRSQGEATIQVRSASGMELAKIKVPGASTAQWVTLAQGVADVPVSLQVSSSRSGGPVYFEGIRTSEGQATDWPWGEEVTLRYGRAERQAYRFGVAGLGGGLFKQLEPIDAQGSTMLGIVR